METEEKAGETPAQNLKWSYLLVDLGPQDIAGAGKLGP